MYIYSAKMYIYVYSGFI